MCAAAELATTATGCCASCALAAELTTTEPEVRQILLAQKAAWNWAEFQARYNFSGWDESTPICAWSGVECAYTYNSSSGEDARSTDPLDGFAM